MSSFEVLSETVIDILKEFSREKRVLTSAALQEALSARAGVLHFAMETSENGGNLTTEIPTDSSTETESLSEFRNVFLEILEGLGPVIKSDYEGKFSELQTKVRECESFPSLGEFGEQIGLMVGELINDSVGRVDYLNNFLVELTNDLYKMEETLLSFQKYNKETNLQGGEFNDNVLSHADDISRAFNSAKNIEDIRGLITSKISAISKAIESKSQEDDIRLREADKKIAELQGNLKIYNKEILQIRKRADCLEKEVLLDELTQVSNRRAYDLQIRNNLKRFHQNGEQFSLILMDIDHFKRVNDEYGHKAGDKCLYEITKLIRGSLRKSDFLARYGGEELIAILHGSNADNAESVAEKIRLRIEKTVFSYQEKIIPITISSGVTEALPEDTDSELPFIRVDEAMYQAKNAGRNQVCVLIDPTFRKTSVDESPGVTGGALERV